jgi:hypothetical protein
MLEQRNRQRPARSPESSDRTDVRKGNSNPDEFPREKVREPLPTATCIRPPPEKRFRVCEEDAAMSGQKMLPVFPISVTAAVQGSTVHSLPLASNAYRVPARLQSIAAKKVVPTCGIPMSVTSPVTRSTERWHAQTRRSSLQPAPG